MLNDSTSSNVNYLSFSSEDLGSEDSFHSTSSFTPLNNLLSNCFSNDSKIFNAVHINAQSVPAHFPDMLATFDSVNMHALLISESWLKPCLPSSCYSLPGFNLIRNDRFGKAGGGVAIYLRSHLTYKIISLSPQPPPSDAAEHIIIEVTLRHTKLLLGVFYSPSLSVNYFHSFESILDQLIPIYEHSLIMGDFNTCIVKNDSRAKTLTTIIESANLHLLPLNPTHTLPNCTPSLLDLIIEAMPPVLRGEMLLDRMRGGQARLNYEQLKQDAEDLELQIKQLQESLDSLVRLQNRSLENSIYGKVNEIQEEISVKKYDYRATQLHLAAVRAQVK
ncbi:unnamed protein product [Colias eurytheme]|nr:unnamed protein product [Colias eurytheme]